MNARQLRSWINAMIETLGYQAHNKAEFAPLSKCLEYNVEVTGTEIRRIQDLLDDLGVATKLIDIDAEGKGSLAIYSFTKRLHSTKRLVEHMKLIGHALPVNKEGKPVNISTETYGRTTKAYLTMSSPAERQSVEDKLEFLGYKVNREYYPGSSIVDVQVSYKKAFGWDK